jgi:hypothetical protein
MAIVIDVKVTALEKESERTHLVKRLVELSKARKD